MAIMRVHRRTGVPGRVEEIAGGACCAAVPGPTFRSTSGRPAASGTPPESGAPASGSVLPERLPLESLPLYLLLGFRGEPPGESPGPETGKVAAELRR